MPHILIINGHPNPTSFSRYLADAYAQAARGEGVGVEQINLCELDFDPVLHAGYRGTQELEADLVKAQESLAACDHLVVVTPVWWGSTPALLKGFFDRALEAKWAYHYSDKGIPQGHFTGRSARLLMTADSPGWYLRLFQGQPTLRQVVNSTMRFCGFGPVKVSRFSPVRTSNAQKREGWLVEAGRIGVQDAKKLLEAKQAGKKAGKKVKEKADPFAIRAELLKGK
ncbi:NAD(P)H-dependent oxidoreductase [Corynebacterium suicordis]|uniref:NAD(P)H-dependent oxidoreductase n=1 Tax=Corynebacterium suicordis DSM 45110 TaxID=1121369 RepID=A0ABR9ZJX0_9CORY|nr:NAD(P)H-dependent oxidoreductase [Corynebacterium suicordis]MBF4552912.1 NAD(P)H-dependent oxidoreductase [Corynebacterium suicordis DSM 45110]MDR6278129.1 putative NADPH-quinone reductase [Corynebacterium suicordis]